LATRLLALATAGLGDDGAHDINHLHRVWRNAALLLQQHPEADALTVMAACYLHDLVNLPKNHPERHLASRQAARWPAASWRNWTFRKTNWRAWPTPSRPTVFPPT
jgi:HD superfamily phosphodiesterase